jgi:hypothetical protein
MSVEDIRKPDANGCCQAPAAPTPEEIINRPGLPAIRYRVGTYSSFRQAMIERSAAIEVGDGEKTAWPLRDWTTRASDDYGVALLEMWAYLADILTFYQERIANEAFLRTAVLPESVRRLVALLGYEPAPGVAAATHLAFAVEKGKRLEISERLRVQSVPGQNEEPQKFETIEAMLAWSSLNEMRPRATEPQTLEDDGKGVTQVDVVGTETGLEVGDYVLLVDEDREDDPGSERWEVRRLNEVEPDPRRNTTRIGWVKGLGKLPFTPPPENPRLFVLGQRAYPFGFGAPDFKVLAPNLKKQYSDWTGKHLPEDINAPNHLFLDAVYDRIGTGSWVVLITTDPLESAVPPRYGSYVELYRVEETFETVRVGYTLTSAVTRLTVDVVKQIRGAMVLEQPENIDYFPIQGTIVLAQTEELTLARLFAESARSLTLDGYYPELQKGRKLILTGEMASGPVEQIVGIVQIDSVEHRTAEGSSRVTFVEDLPKVKPESVRFYGNAAEATHGETVAEEVLGSGDASKAFQSFSVRRSPVTFVRQPAAPRGTASTLKVRVGGVEWREVPSLHGHGGDERIYTTSVDEEGTMRVQFGDGKTGARLPSGRDNVVAAYRQGLGRDGIVTAGSLKTLLDRPVGLRGVTNPAASEGGVDRESLHEARANAPNTVRTFDRIVSLRDFEDAAREFVGVAKAQATMVRDGGEQMVVLTIAGHQGTDVDRLCADLEMGLDKRRDPNRKLDVVRYDPVPVQVEATVHIDPDHQNEAVLAAAREALEEAFAFERLELGQDINLSDTYRVLQEVDGLHWVSIDRLHFKEEAESVQAHLPIHPGRLAIIADPPTDIVVNPGVERS